MPDLITDTELTSRMHTRSNQKKIAQLIIARLDGTDVKKNFRYYHSLVRKGIGGFIIFNGNLKVIRPAIKKLQESAEIPLIISSDLEQGLGQHITGGTVFPPAMALGQAINPKNKKDVRLLRKSISIMATEAKAAGITTIFAPVLDVNTNPKNPIICTRAFSDNPGKVAWFGNEFIRGLQRHGIISCAKHFPGHGDTLKDSHRELPVIKADVKRLRNIELYPFYRAIKAGVQMIMVGHLKVPVIDSRLPSSLSRKITENLLRKKMRFKGLVITDAMNMHALTCGEEKACFMALKAGADILLHPGNPQKIIDFLSSKWHEIMPQAEVSFQKIVKVKKELNRSQGSGPACRPPAGRTGPGRVRGQGIGTKSHWGVARELTQKSIKIKFLSGTTLKKFNEKHPSPIPLPRGDGARGRVRETLTILIIDDDDSKSGGFFVKAIKKRYKKIKVFYVDNNTRLTNPSLVTRHSSLIIAVFSKISAWKGSSGLSSKLKAIIEKAVKASGHSVIAGFCCPYALSDIKADAIIHAYSGSELAQEAVAKALFDP